MKGRQCPHVYEIMQNVVFCHPQAKSTSLHSAKDAAEAEAESLRAALTSAQQQLEEGEVVLANLNRQLAEVRQRLNRSAAAAEEQAARADKWEEQCISASPLHATYSLVMNHACQAGKSCCMLEQEPNWSLRLHNEH